MMMKYRCCKCNHTISPLALCLHFFLCLSVYFLPTYLVKPKPLPLSVADFAAPQVLANQQVGRTPPMGEQKSVVVVVNRKRRGSPLTAHWDDIGFQSNAVEVYARELWEYRTLETPFQGNLTTFVDPHSCKMFILAPISS